MGYEFKKGIRRNEQRHTKTAAYRETARHVYLIVCFCAFLYYYYYNFNSISKSAIGSIKY
jgi:hypothetical protein